MKAAASGVGRKGELCHVGGGQWEGGTVSYRGGEQRLVALQSKRLWKPGLCCGGGVGVRKPLLWGWRGTVGECCGGQRGNGVSQEKGVAEANLGSWVSFPYPVLTFPICCIFAYAYSAPETQCRWIHTVSHSYVTESHRGPVSVSEKARLLIWFWREKA